MKIFIFDPLWEKLSDEKLLESLAKCNCEVSVVTDIKLLSENVELYDGDEERIVCLNPDYVNWHLKNEDYETIPNLKAILVASTGYEWIEKEAADKQNIAICNIRGFSTQAVAEWAITMMFNLARQTPRLIKDGFPLDFDADFMKYRGIQLKGKTAGIVGLGNIGKVIAEACTGLGMNVVYWSRSKQQGSYEYVELQKLMEECDVIFPALAKNADTLKLIDESTLRSMKKSAILVDIAHGLFDQKVVLEMIDRGMLVGYGFEAEPGKFAEYTGNVWAAPAYGWTTYESMYSSEEKLVENIIEAVNGKYPNRVN